MSLKTDFTRAAIALTVTALFFAYTTSKIERCNEPQAKKAIKKERSINSSNNYKLNDSTFNATRSETINYYQVLQLLIKVAEDFKPYEYKCSAGVKTRGHGLTKPEVVSYNKRNNTDIEWTDIDNVHTSTIIIQDILEERFQRIRTRYDFLDAPTTFALISLSYNAGPNILKSPSIQHGLAMYQRTQGKDRESLSKALLLFSYAKVKGKKKWLRGLNNRRKIEIKLLQRDFSPKDLDRLKIIVKNQEKA